MADGNDELISSDRHGAYDATQRHTLYSSYDYFYRKQTVMFAVAEPEPEANRNTFTSFILLPNHINQQTPQNRPFAKPPTPIHARNKCAQFSSGEAWTPNLLPRTPH